MSIRRCFSNWMLLLLLPALAIVPFLGQFAYTANSSYSDLAISHYPNALYIQHAIFVEHQFPLWSPTILSGYPFVADPLSGLWYLPGWLGILLPQPFGLNLLAVLHLLFGGMGMYLFLRGERLDLFPALFGGLAFEALPRLFAHFASGHIYFVIAAAWTPWLLLAAQNSGLKPRGRKPDFWQGLVLGTILLADARWAAYAALLWLPYRLTLVGRIRDKGRPGYQRAVNDILRQIVVAVLIAAPLLLPLAEYTRLSTRASMGPSANMFLSMPPARLLGLLIPSTDGNTEWTVYPGALLTVAFVWISLNRCLRNGRALFLAVVPLALFLALGSNIPGLALFWRLPGFSLLRVPARFVLLAGVCLPVLGAYLIQVLSTPAGLGQKEAFWARLLVAAGVGFTVLVAGGMLFVSHEMPLNFAWGAAAITLSGLLVLMRDKAVLPRGAFITAAFALLVLDQVGISAQSVYFRPPQSVLAESAQAAQWLSRQPGLFRVYSPSYSIPQQTAASYGLQLVGGIDPMQLASYTRLVEKASGVPLKGYDVVLPPFANGNPSRDNASYLPNASYLGLLNARYIVSEFPIPGFPEKARFGDTRIYENTSGASRAWIVRDLTSSEAVQAEPVDRVLVQPNDVWVTASGPGVLELSEIDYPGWTVTVDGQRGKIESFAGVLRAVRLGPGQHQVRFAFRPLPVFVGLALAALTWAYLAYSGGRIRKVKRW